MVGHVAPIREKRTAYKVGYWWRPLRRPRRRWVGNIKMNLIEIGWGGSMDWIDLAQDRYQWMVMKCWEVLE
jgi:hypothetical protein